MSVAPGQHHWPADVDGRCVDRRLEVRRIELFDHLDTDPAVPGDLVDVRAVHEARADAGVAQGVASPAASFPVELQLQLTKTLFISSRGVPP